MVKVTGSPVTGEVPKKSCALNDSARAARLKGRTGLDRTSSWTNGMESSEESPVRSLAAVAVTNEPAGIVRTGTLKETATPGAPVVTLVKPRKVLPCGTGSLAGLAKNSRRKVVLP